MERMDVSSYRVHELDEEVDDITMSKYNPRSDTTGDTGTVPRSDEVDLNLDDLSVGVESVFDTTVDERPQIDTRDTATLHLDNIGGIDTADITLERGLTVLAGRNATNRTSTLRGLCAALGADETTPATRTLSTDAADGEVVLTLGDTTYTRTYDRNDRGVVSTSGDPYSDSAAVVDAFVALLEENPARRAVERGADADELRDILMRPVDTAEIDRKITELERQRRQIGDRLESIDDERTRLPGLTDRRDDIAADLEGIEDEIAEIETEIDAYDADEEEAERAEELLDDLQKLRMNLGETEDQIEYHREKVVEYREEREEVAMQLDEMDVPADEIERIDDEISQLQRRKRHIEDTIGDLGSIINVNEDLVEGDADFAPGATRPGGSVDEETSGAEALTSGLDPGTETVECWTCGSDVQRETIENRIDTLRSLRNEKRDEINDIEAEIAALQDEKADLESQRDEYQQLQLRSDTLAEQIQHHESQADSLGDDVQTLRDDIDDLEDQVEATEELRESDLVDAYQRRSELEYERGRIEQELSDIKNEIGRIEGLVDERDNLEATRDDIADVLEALRGRVDEAERATVDAFNDHMETVIDFLDYGNISRVWIDRKPGEGTADPGAFDLHVVREREDGTVYDDDIDTLSESEREVIGLVVALTGYVVHRVYEEIPFLVMDSLEAIDATRLADVLSYFGSRTGFLVAALLPEDAETSLEGDFTDVDSEPVVRNADDVLTM